jgi:FMN phosphatase YigB (HAD superfamily)
MNPNLPWWEKLLRRIKQVLFFWKAERGVWVFDLDGPLMDTGVFYERALDEFSRELFKIFDGKFSVVKILDKQHDLDLGMMYDINPRTQKPYLLHKSRFPLSLVRCYKHFCKEADVKFDRKIAHKLSSIGKKVFCKEEYLKVIRPEVLPLFRFLKNLNEKIFILTKGDDEIQGDKRKALEKAGIMAYCDGFFVVPNHKNAKIKEIKRKNPALHYYCVGDTYKEDVEIGMRLWFFGIYTPYKYNWKERGKFNEIEYYRDKNRSVRCSSIAEISSWFNTIKGA